MIGHQREVAVLLRQDTSSMPIAQPLGVQFLGADAGDDPPDGVPFDAQPCA
jgi:hypothetical protein